MKLRGLAFSTLLLSILFISFTSCKNCKVEGDHTHDGLIVKESIVYPPSGNITHSMAGNYHIYNGGPHSNGNWQISFDGGVTKQALDFSIYSVVACPTTVKCGSIFTRSFVQELTGEMTYTVRAETCKHCKMTTYVENYSLVAALPASQVINYVPQIIEN